MLLQKFEWKMIFDDTNRMWKILLGWDPFFECVAYYLERDFLSQSVPIFSIL